MPINIHNIASYKVMICEADVHDLGADIRETCFETFLEALDFIMGNLVLKEYDITFLWDSVSFVWRMGTPDEYMTARMWRVY